MINKVLGISYLKNQSTSMKLRKHKPKEKTKNKTEEHCETHVVMHMFRDVQQQNLWY
jgi:hypothetical protein